MNHRSDIEIAYDKINKREETISESLVLTRPDLIYSHDYSNILLTTHNLSDNFVDIFNTASITYNIIKSNNCSRLFLVTPTRNLHYYILNKFKHIDYIIDTDKLLNILKSINTFNITKIIYLPSEYYEMSLPIKNYPPISIEMEDILRSYNIIGDNDNILLVSCTHYTNNELKSVYEIIKTLTMPCVVLTNKKIHQLNIPQISYEDSEYEIGDIIGTGIGLLSRLKYVCITPNKHNIFDLFKKCLTNTSS